MTPVRTTTATALAPPATTSAKGAPRSTAATPQAFAALLGQDPKDWAAIKAAVAQVDAQAAHMSPQQAAQWSPLLEQAQTAAQAEDRNSTGQTIGEILLWILGIIPGLIFRLADMFDGNSSADRALTSTRAKVDARRAPGSPSVPAPTGGATAQQLRPITYTRTTNIEITARTERFPLSAARTEQAVATALQPNTTTDAQLDRMHARLANIGASNDAIPTAAQARDIRTKYAAMNQAIAAGDFVTAKRLGAELGLPIGELTEGSPAQMRTAMALGLLTPTVLINGTQWTAGYSATSNQDTRVNAVEGQVHYANLMDDMAAKGVSPLSSPPTEPQVRQYLEHVSEQARRQAQIDHPGSTRAAVQARQAAVTAAGMAANRLLMDGMQVHYRGASGRDIQYGEPEKQLVYLTRNHQLLLGPDGQPVSIEVPTGAAHRAERTRLMREFQQAHPGYVTFSDLNQPPEGFADSTSSRATYGSRSESDCEGMASFRLRTLPEGWTGVGVVSGQPPGGGIGHAVAVVRSPDGRTFISSNGKPLIEVPAPANAAQIQTAVETEFATIYHGTNTNGFSWGIGTGAPDTALREAASRSTLHRSNVSNGNMPAEDYSRLAP